MQKVLLHRVKPSERVHVLRTNAMIQFEAKKEKTNKFY